MKILQNLSFKKDIRNILKIGIYIFLIFWVLFEIILFYFYFTNYKEGFDVSNYISTRKNDFKNGAIIRIGDPFNDRIDKTDNEVKAYNERVFNIFKNAGYDGPKDHNVLKGIKNAIKNEINEYKDIIIPKLQVEIIVTNSRLNGYISSIQNDATNLLDIIEDIKPMPPYSNEYFTQTNNQLIQKIYNELKDLTKISNSIINTSSLNSVNDVNDSLDELNDQLQKDEVPDEYIKQVDNAFLSINNSFNYINNTYLPILNTTLSDINKYVPNPIPEGIPDNLSTLYEQLTDVNNTIQNLINEIKILNTMSIDSYNRFSTALATYQDTQKLLKHVFEPYKRFITGTVLSAGFKPEDMDF